MLLNVDHDVLEIERRNVSRALRIFALKCFHRILFVEIVQQLRELGIVDGALLFLCVVVGDIIEKSISISKNFDCRNVSNVPCRNIAE